MQSVKQKNIKLFPIVALAIVGIFLLGCETDMKQVKSFAKKGKEPLREAETLKILYSEYDFSV